jgi:hypothetical protein
VREKRREREREREKGCVKDTRRQTGPEGSAKKCTQRKG